MVARALLTLLSIPATMKELRDQVIAKKLSVRQTEQLIRTATRQPVSKPASKKNDSELSRSVCKAFENQISNRLSSQVVINQNGSRGKIEIAYYSYDDLERIISMLTQGAEQ